MMSHNTTTINRMENTAVVRVKSIREIEQHWSQTSGQPLFTLMQKASEQLLALIKQVYPDANSIFCFCGPGQNGGDGYLLATLAQKAGYDVDVIATAPPSDPNSDAFQAYTLWTTENPLHTTIPNKTPDLMVDALFGIGLNRAPEGIYQQWITDMNASNKPVLSVDCPSGLAADTGFIPGMCVQAQTTLTFVQVKTGLVTGSACDVVGQLHLAPLIDSPTPNDITLTHYATQARLQPRRKRSAHKGDCGRVLIVGGSSGLLGAAILAGSAALRCGCGMVKLMINPNQVDAPALVEPTLMSTHWQDHLAWQWPDVLLIGCGLQQGVSMSMWHQILEKRQCPAVIDADALNQLAKNPVFYPQWILTPHAMEAARLLDCQINHIHQDRFAATRAIQKKFGGVVVLKGPGTIIDDGQRVFICGHGNPGMACAGMGDVLAGMIAAFLAQNQNAHTHAATLGVCLHAHAADKAAEYGENSLIPTDLLPEIRQIMHNTVTEVCPP